MTLTADTLIAYLRNDLNLEDDIAPETELFSSGLLDSVAMMTIIAFVEEQAGIEVRPADVTLENFDTVQAIVAYAHAEA
ncbi:Acyl carrier protein [Gemmobacter aquatilis]|uniref:Acyl carrier protein n=1 Tax=Gemmobacter aquatilis TaxID=933059 RepID=A0A1H8JKV6_9RHOB|nr:acyl carrier protein [Gemmobacter aquatilis]SEN81161.1 Acyl carrier protein [Gemmobacter aquatilis]